MRIDKQGAAAYAAAYTEDAYAAYAAAYADGVYAAVAVTDAATAARECKKSHWNETTDTTQNTAENVPAPVAKACSKCGSREIVWDTHAIWDIQTQRFVITDVRGDLGCHYCDNSEIVDVPLTPVNTALDEQEAVPVSNPFERFRAQAQTINVREFLASEHNTEGFTAEVFASVRNVMVYPGGHIIEELLQGGFLAADERHDFLTAYQTRDSAEAGLFNYLSKLDRLPEEFRTVTTKTGEKSWASRA